MANDYYTRQGSYTKGTLARGDVVKTDFDALVTAFDSAQTNIKRALKLPNEGSPQTDFAITANAATRATKAIGFDSDGVIELQTGAGNWEGTWAASTAYELRDVIVDGSAGSDTDNLYICILAHTSGTFSTDLSASKWQLMIDVEESRNWAKKTTGVVADSEYSSKAYAIGGTGVTDTAGKGASKEWAIETSGTVDGTSFSSKEYAQGVQASTGGSAKDYAQKTDGGVSGATSDHSAKSWAVGGTGVTTTASKGAAKEWATTTGGYVDTAEYSSKEYAIGTTATSAKDYATKTSAAVTGSEFSAKEYAQGTQASTGGSAKSWAQDADQVDGASTNDRSAKGWAQGTLTGATLGGSAKDWAQTAEDSAVDGSEYSAKHYSAKSSASATASASSATSASSSASSAASSSSSAATSATSASNSLATFQGQYHGALSSDPSSGVDTGDLYFSTTVNLMRVYNGSSWDSITTGITTETDPSAIAMALAL